MIVSLFGLILIQGLWIKYAVETERARFDQLVYSSMKSALSNVQRSNVYEFIDEKIELPKPAEISVTIEELSEISEHLSDISEPIKEIVVKSIDINGNILVTYDSLHFHENE